MDQRGIVHIDEFGALKTDVVHVDVAVDHATSDSSVHTIPLRWPEVESTAGIETEAKNGCFEFLADERSGSSAIAVHIRSDLDAPMDVIGRVGPFVHLVEPNWSVCQTEI